MISKLRAARARRRAVSTLVGGDWAASFIDGGSAMHRFRNVLATVSRTHGNARLTDALSRQGLSVEGVRMLLIGVNHLDTAFAITADIMAGNPPTWSVPEGFEIQGERLERALGASLFSGQYHDACRRVLAFDAQPIRALVEDGEVRTELCDPGEVLPTGQRGVDGQPREWQRRWVVERKDGLRRQLFLRVETHTPGLIENAAYRTSSKDVLQVVSKLERVPLESVYRDGEEAVPEMAETGLDHVPIIELVLYRDGREPLGKVGAADMQLVEASVAALSRMDRTMEQHGHPKIRAGRLDDKGTFKISDDVIQDPGKLVEYLRPEFDFDAMVKHFNVLTNHILLRLGIAPALLGIKPEGGAAPDSYDKLRLESTQTLAMANRARVHHEDALERLFGCVSAIDSTGPLAGYPVGPVSVVVNPELPKDQMQRARDVAEMKLAGLVDDLTAIELVWGQDKARMISERMAAQRAAEADAARREVFLDPMQDIGATGAGDGAAVPDEGGEAGDEVAA